jgi:4-hydroxy-tetrahydrodipicolinate synthase
MSAPALTASDLEGVYVPLVTPFDDDGEIDEPAVRAVAEFVLAAGVRGVVAMGTTGEYYAMSTDERLRVMELVADTVGRRAQLVAGCNAGGTREVIALARAAGEMGYHAVMLAAPPTSLPSQRELAAHYLAVAEQAGLPIILYNYPARAGVEIGFECLDAIADHPQVLAIKESSGDFSRFLQLRQRYAGRVAVMCGSDDQAADYFFWGVRSWLAGTANVLPRHHVAILAAANAGHHAAAQCLFAGILPWVQHMESGGYNAKAKLGLIHQGIAAGVVRAPLLPLDDDVAADSLRVLDAALAVSLEA